MFVVPPNNSGGANNGCVWQQGVGVGGVGTATNYCYNNNGGSLLLSQSQSQSQSQISSAAAAAAAGGATAAAAVVTQQQPYRRGSCSSSRRGGGGDGRRRSRRRRRISRDDDVVEDDDVKLYYEYEYEDDYSTPEEVLRRIESLAESFVEDVDVGTVPLLRAYDEGGDKKCHNDDNNGDDDATDSDSDDKPKNKYRKATTAATAKRFDSMNQCRSYTSVWLVLSFCHSLLSSGSKRGRGGLKTTTVREVYYHYVTHFRSQRECDAAVTDAAALLRVPRHALGLKASPRGWFCGDVRLVVADADGGNEEEEDGSGAGGDFDRDVGGDCFDGGRGSQQQQQRNQQQQEELEVILDGSAAATATHLGGHGFPISSDWLLPPGRRRFVVETRSAACVLVVEKEGVYNRLVEDRFYERYPCVLVTGKGFPDLATRAMVHACHVELGLPVWGLADCDPHGVMVLHTYQHGGKRSGGLDGGGRYGVPIRWLGLRPSQVRRLKKGTKRSTTTTSTTTTSSLPDAVFLQLQEHDKRRLKNHLLKEGHRWIAPSYAAASSCDDEDDSDNNNNNNYRNAERRIEELEDMLDSGYKVELEALNWLGMDYVSEWVGRIFEHNLAATATKEKNDSAGRRRDNQLVGGNDDRYDDDDDADVSAGADDRGDDGDDDENEWLEII